MPTTDTTQNNTLTMAELLDMEKPISQLQRGDVVEGTIIDKQHGEVLVDVGAKAEGVIMPNEVREEKETIDELKPGDKLLVYVVSTENEHGQIQLSLKRASITRKWINLKKAAEEGTVMPVKVVEYNKGGLIVETQRVRGFIPFSHLMSGPARTATPQEVTEELNQLIGQELQAVVIEADQKTNRLILSEKKAHQDAEREKKAAAMTKFKVGQVIQGTVVRIMPFGLLVAIGDGVEGLVHASEISWDKSVDFTADFGPGQPLDVKVIELDQESGKINLSLKQLSQDPWEDKANQFEPGQTVKGTVSKITSYGTIIDVDGIDALLRAPATDLNVGDLVEVAVENVDHTSRRLDVTQS